MPTYTISAGDQPKLLATEPGTGPVGSTRTVTSLRGLDLTDAVELAAALSRLGNELTNHTWNWHEFAEHATTLGVRYAQLVPAAGTLALSQLADLGVPAGNAWKTPLYGPVADLGRILTTVDQLPAPAQRAVRTELRAVLALFDGPVVEYGVGGFDGIERVNAVEFCRDAEPELLRAIVLDDAGMGRMVGEEEICEFYSQQGRALEGLMVQLVTAEYEIYTELKLRPLVMRLTETRPELMAEFLDDLDPEDLDLGLDAETIEEVRRKVADHAG